MLGMSVWNALDPYFWMATAEVGRYLIQGNRTTDLPPVWIPQLNGYMGVPGPLYEACWYLPVQGVFSAAVRGGIAPSKSLALRLGVDHLPLLLGIELTALTEVIRQDQENGASVHAEFAFPFKRFMLGPTVSYKTPEVWTPFAYGFEADATIGIMAQYGY